MGQESVGYNLSTRRRFLKQLGATGLALAFPATQLARAQAREVVRVWGEPGPYGAVAAEAMNAWALENAPHLRFEIETIPWDDVYPKLMTDIAAGRPPSCISVESPIAFQLAAEGLLVPLDDLVERIGPERLIDQAEWGYWGKWRGHQYVIPAHHQSELMIVRQDIVDELGLPAPDTWTWDDLLEAAKEIQGATGMYGIAFALGRNAATEYYLTHLLHQAGARMFDVHDDFRVTFESDAAVETFEFVAKLYEYMPPGAVGYTFLDVVDAMVTERAGIVFYWGRVFGRAAEENMDLFSRLEAYQHAAHPRTGKRYNWNDFQGFLIPARNNKYIDAVKEALVYFNSSREWCIQYAHSLMPNVSPVYKDVLEDSRMREHPFYETKERTINEYFVESLKYASTSGNELLEGINPFAGIVHGRTVLAQAIQQVVIDRRPAAEAVRWCHEQLEAIRREHLRLVV